MASLFTTKRKQKEAAVESCTDTKVKKKKKLKEAVESGTNTKVKKSSKKPKRAKNVDEDEDDAAKDSEEAKTKKAQELVKREDEKEEKERKRIPEQEERTVFVGNLPVSATKKQLLKMFSEFGKVETVRFRGAARPDMNTTKKMAVIKRAIHENRHNITAYVRFKERAEAEKAAAAANGVKLDENILRVDLAAAPAGKKTAHEHGLAVFVGNMS